MLTLRGLLEQREALNHQIAAAKVASREQAVIEILRLMALYDIKFREVDQRLDLLLKTRRKAAKTRATVLNMVKFASGRAGRAQDIPKYRHPETGHTWSGRGAQPKWLKAALETGLTLDAMLIQDQPKACP